MKDDKKTKEVACETSPEPKTEEQESELARKLFDAGRVFMDYYDSTFERLAK